MDGKRPGTTLSDSALDRELDAALNVDPSPEFLARVRMRVASEPDAAAWRVTWRQTIAAAALAAVAIVALMSYWPPSDSATPQEATAPAAPVQEHVATPRPLEQPPSSVPVAILPPSRETVVARQPIVASVERKTDRPRLPEIVISRDEQRAFELLLRTVREGRLPPLPDAGDSALPVPAALDIRPVIIEPLPQIARLE